MARRRLSPVPGTSPAGPAPETKSFAPPRAPIAHVAGEAAAAAALGEVAGELARARDEGRLVQRLPLAAVEPGWLVRDRLAIDEAELGELAGSLRARGQQTPVEVAEIAPGRYGLISGWRRWTALQRLHAETGEARFATILALVRRPDDAADAYLAMVEENEIRAGLSYYERARIVARAAELGIFASEAAALRALFAQASRARRSKIAAFLPIVAALDGRLAFPAAIPERLGLALAKALSEDPGFGPRLAERLRKAAPADAEAERALLQRALRDAARPAAGGTAQEKGTGAAPAPRPAEALPPPPPGAEEPVPGIWFEEAGTGGRRRFILSGPRATAAFRARLLAWLGTQAAGS